MEISNFGFGGKGGAGARKGEEAEGDSSNRKTVVKFVGRWTVFQTHLRAICTVFALEMSSPLLNV